MDSRRSVARLLAAGVWTSAAMLAAGLYFREEHWLRGGLIVLLATPPARVMALLLAWAWEKDWLFAGASLAVLGLMSLPLLF